jgi:hypothetical protein
MNTVQINRALKKHPVTKKCFRGVYSLDTLPPKKYLKKPSSFIVNTDPSNKPGTHWIAIYLPANGRAEFFDSYGRWPAHKNFQTFIHKNTKKPILYNKMKLQSPLSTVCGKYCCLYLFYKCNGKSMKEFQKLYGPDRRINDRITENMFKKIFV